MLNSATAVARQARRGIQCRIILQQLGVASNGVPALGTQLVWNNPSYATDNDSSRVNPVGAAHKTTEGDKVFTGTAEVDEPAPTDSSSGQQQPNVPTDANRRWMSGDDLGTRADKAGIDTAKDTTTGTDASCRVQDRARELASEADSKAGSGECHPADPYCQSGEKPPHPDDFHDAGDKNVPPSAGFPA